MRGALGLRDLILAWYGGTVLAVLVLVLLSVHLEVSRETSRLVAAQMDATRQAIESLTEERTATLDLLARLAGQEPRLGAVMGTDPVTITDVLTRDLNPSLAADFIRVTDARGRVRADTTGRAKPGTDLSGDAAVRAALSGNGWRGMLVVPGEIDLVATAPIHVGGQDLGTVTLGRRVGDEMAAQLFRRTGSRVTLFAGGQVAASNWPPALRPALLCALQGAGPATVPSKGQTLRFMMPFAGHRRMCLLTSLAGQGGARGELLIQSNLDAALRPYANIQRTLMFIGLIGLLIAALGSVIIIHAETEHMSRIIEQLRMLARADSGELLVERHPVALDDLVREVAHRAEVLARARRVRLRTERLDPMVLEGDEDQLRRLVLNLIDNAIQYTPEGGEIRLRLALSPAGPNPARGEALLEVEDTGIGVEPADLAHIFDRFYRVDKAGSRTQGGSGPGLAICRWIAEAHGGGIEVRSSPGAGSCFRVCLPGAVSPVGGIDENAYFTG